METAKTKFAKLNKLQQERSDLDKALRTSSPESLTEWLIACHGMPEGSREIVVSNLADSFLAQRVKGQLLPLTGFDVEVKLFGWTILRIKNATP